MERILKPNPALVCPICVETIEQHSLFNHLVSSHPRFADLVERKRINNRTQYQCKKCGTIDAGLSCKGHSIFQHLREVHREDLSERAPNRSDEHGPSVRIITPAHLTEKRPEFIVSASTVGLDALIIKHTELLIKSQKQKETIGLLYDRIKTAEAKCVEYCGKILELQEILSNTNK